MKTIIFVCHGSICRSPAAEWIMKSLTDKFKVYSRALSYEELGNDIYPPMKEALNKTNIKYNKHEATLLTKEDISNADYIFYMNSENKSILEYRYGNNKKFLPITKFNNDINEIEDPWYTNRFDYVVKQIKQCCISILNSIE